MRWRKLGKLFDPRDHKLANNCVEYAQSPQALIRGDFVRIYFSTRERDRTGKFVSHISYVDFDHRFESIVKVAAHTVIPLGELGDFDEHGIFPVHIFENGKEIWGYTTGWNRKVSVSADASIGLAISKDGGETFEKIGKGPILTSSLFEPFLIGDAFVLRRGETFHMWYIYGTKWAQCDEHSQPDRVYKIGHATSHDGVSWKKEGRQLISDKLNENECQALPSVAYFDGKYHMVFCYRQATGFRSDKDSAYRIGFAYSHDLKDWIRADEQLGIDVSDQDWDSEMMCYPHIFKYNGHIYMLYNGNQFGKYGFGLAVMD